jgi:hypothetical protein
MLSIVTGRPGAGKSYFGTELAWRAAGLGRPVCTNLALRGDWPGHVRRLDESEVRDFWLYRYRSGGWVKHGDLSECGGAGVLYIIDEAHLFWGSREWQQVGREVLRYWSQHRKLGDDVVLVTQACGALDKAIRRLAGEFVVVRNMDREPVGGFRIPRVRVTYSLAEPERADWRLWVIKSEWVRLRPEVFERFDSFAGVGVVQGTVGGDNSSARRGRSLVWLGAAILGVVVCAVGVPLAGSKGLEWVLRSFLGGGSDPVAVAQVGDSGAVGVREAAFAPVVGAVQSGGEDRVRWQVARVFVCRWLEGAGVYWWVVGSEPGMRGEVEDVGVEVDGLLVGRRSVVDGRGDSVRWVKRSVDAGAEVR